MINLIVAGAGEGTYKKLWPALSSKNPDLGMRLAVVIDVKKQAELHPKMQEILKLSGAQYIQTKPGTKPQLGTLPENPAAIIMTPNDSHFFYANFFTTQDVKTFIEKPLTSNAKELKSLRFFEQCQKKMGYGAESATDGKGLGMLLASGALKLKDRRLPYVAFNPKITPGDLNWCFKSLGFPIMIEGKLLEGIGTAGTADHRPWLLDGRQGGMIRDLSSHLFGPLYESGIISSGTVPPGCRVALGKYEPGEPPGTFRPLKDETEGETYAEIEGNLFTVDQTTGLVRFKFQVGKYWPTHDRVLRVWFSRGELELSYESPYRFTMSGDSFDPTSIDVTADPYALSYLDFASFISGETDGHLNRAIEIVSFNETMRAVGLKSI